MRLLVLDVDGVLTRSFLEDPLPRDASPEERAARYDRVDLLPGRPEQLRRLRDAGWAIALATNQGGVACGYQTLDQVERKLSEVARQLGLGEVDVGDLEAHDGGAAITYATSTGATVHVAYAHPRPRDSSWRSVAGEAAFWRKPGPGVTPGGDRALALLGR